MQDIGQRLRRPSQLRAQTGAAEDGQQAVGLRFMPLHRRQQGQQAVFVTGQFPPAQGRHVQAAARRLRRHPQEGPHAQIHLTAVIATGDGVIAVQGGATFLARRQPAHCGQHEP